MYIYFVISVLNILKKWNCCAYFWIDSLSRFKCDSLLIFPTIKFVSLLLVVFELLAKLLELSVDEILLAGFSGLPGEWMLWLLVVFVLFDREVSAVDDVELWKWFVIGETAADDCKYKLLIIYSYIYILILFM